MSIDQDPFAGIHKATVSFIGKMAKLSERTVDAKRKGVTRKRKQYMLKRSQELSFELFCLISGKRVAYLYDHGAFSKQELASLLESLNMHKILKVVSVSDTLKLGRDTMEHNESIFLLNVKCMDMWMKNYMSSKTLPIFVNISCNLKEPKWVRDPNIIEKYVDQFKFIVANVSEDITAEKTSLDNVPSYLKVHNADFDMVAIHGMLLNYPVVYCSSSAQNCLSNVPLTSFSVSPLCFPTVNGKHLPYTCYGFTCPTHILELCIEKQDKTLVQRIENSVLNGKFDDKKLFRYDVRAFCPKNSVGV